MKGDEDGAGNSKELPDSNHSEVQEDPDPDGDLLSDDQDASPFVANIPTIDFAFSDVELGLDIETKSDALQTELTLQKRDFRQKVDRSDIATRSLITRDSRKRMVGFGGGGVHVGPYYIPVGFSGGYRQKTSSVESRYSSTHIVSEHRLKEISKSFKRMTQQSNRVRIGPKAGYVKVVLRMTNVSSESCRVDDFDVNVKINGREKWTFLASAGGFRSRTMAGQSDEQESVILVFKGIRTSDVKEFISSMGSAEVTFAVSPSSVKPSLIDLFDAVRKKCATVEIVREGKSELHYISVIQVKEMGVTLHEMLRRIPGAEDVVEWGNGPLGDYLKTFCGIGGCGFLFPDSDREGKWFVFRNRVELSGDCRQLEILPGEHIRIQYIKTEEYWDRVDEWEGYVAACVRLRTVWSRENAFWQHIDSIGRGDGPMWDANAQQQVCSNARKLHEKYMMFFEDAETPGVIKALYPGHRERMKKFEAWFCNDEVALPSFALTVVGARVSWNVDRELIPTFRLSCRGIVIEGKEFEADETKRSGTIRIKADGTKRLVWSPFDTITLRVSELTLGGFKETSLLNFRADGLAGLIQLFGKKPLKLSDDSADPALCRIELLFEPAVRDAKLATEDETEPLCKPYELEDFLQSQWPEVINYDISTVPSVTAQGLFLQHHPVCYRRSAILFEELYGRDKNLSDLSTATVSYFRSFSFKRAANLAQTVITLVGLDAEREEMDEFITGISYADLRRIREVSVCAERLTPDCAALNALVRSMCSVSTQMA